MFCKSRIPEARPAASKREKRGGFTLIELLIVMAILGLLATIVVPQASHAIENAKAQKCRNNLKQLHAAILGYMADHRGSREDLPAAQSHEVYSMQSGTYHHKKAWVAWVPNDNKYEAAKQDSPWNEKPKESHSAEFRDDLGIGPDAKYAVENGVLFDYAGDMAFYVCPLIRAKVAPALEFAPDSPLAQAENGRNIYRTYAMNPFFRCSERPGWYTESSKIGVTLSYGGHVPEPAKLLLFTEIEPSADDSPQRSKREDKARNGAWSHDGCINPEKWDSRGDNDEKIYAVHRSGKKKGATCALAIFFDGHVETVEPLFEGRGNTAWFLNRGWNPADSDPTASN